MQTRHTNGSGYFRVLGVLGLFAVAMAYLESAVVVYLRAVFYPGGFAFPLKESDVATFLIELGREAATMVMLVTVACLAWAPGWGRFACFAFLFGVWDIWYYIWLKIFLSWPESLLTWDVLFLIPVVWIGPVLAPVLISLLLAAGGVRILQLLDRGVRLCVNRWDWIGGGAGVLLALYTFMEDVTGVLVREGVEAVTSFVPAAFNWPVFALGFVLMAAIPLRVIVRSQRAFKQEQSEDCPVGGEP